MPKISNFVFFSESYLYSYSGNFVCPSNSSSSFQLPQNNRTFCSPNDPTVRSLFNGTRYLPEDEPGAPWTTDPGCRVGIPGLWSGVIARNFLDLYRQAGEANPGQPAVGSQVPSDVATSFTILLAIFFPSVTGIMAGSNRCGLS